MTQKSNEKYYQKNEKYSNFLDNQDSQDFRKYIDHVLNLSKKNSHFLDVGCGTGVALNLLEQKIKCSGVEISDTSIAKCLKKNLDCKKYDGKTLPFKNESFDIVGSFNVLEHTDKPLEFLTEQKRVLKKRGYLIVVCPNFLAVTNSYHYHTTGVKQKLSNLQETIRKLASSKIEIKKMETTDRENFQPDDDACNITNPIDIIRWAKNNNLELKDWSSRSTYTTGLANILDKPVLKMFAGSNFLIFEKT